MLFFLVELLIYLYKAVTNAPAMFLYWILTTLVVLVLVLHISQDCTGTGNYGA